MPKQPKTASKTMTAHPHQVALPYRGDGVARALHDAFDADEKGVPSDMAALLTVLDRSPVPTELFDLVHDRIEC